MTKRIGLGQLRNHACGYFERVEAGETIEVIRRGKLVARIEPATGNPADRLSFTRTVDLPVRGTGGRIGLDEVRTQAGRHFDRVAAGESVEVVWRGKLVARIVSAEGAPLNPPAADQSANTAAGETCVRIGIDELRHRAARYFERAAAGETFEVIKRGRPVGRVVSAGEDSRESA